MKIENVRKKVWKNLRNKEDGRSKHMLKYTDEELLNFLRNFYLKNGRVPVRRDFNNDSGYPNPSTYRRRFGGWTNALKKTDEKYIENKEADS